MRQSVPVCVSLCLSVHAKQLEYIRQRGRDAVGIAQVDAGLEALEAALSAGFEQYNKVRTDPNLESLRKSPKFKKLIDQYDEPIINEGALK